LRWPSLVWHSVAALVAVVLPIAEPRTGLVFTNLPVNYTCRERERESVCASQDASEAIEECEETYACTFCDNYEGHGEEKAGEDCRRTKQLFAVLRLFS